MFSRAYHSVVKGLGLIDDNVLHPNTTPKSHAPFGYEVPGGGIDRMSDLPSRLERTISEDSLREAGL